MEPDVREELARYFAERADRPFGDAESASGRLLQRFSVAGQEAAINLLVKAERALDRGETERARAYVDRATRLPYDRHEEAHPAAMEAHMQLFCLVTDVLEESAEDDWGWLDAAVAALSSADEAGRCTLRDVLAAVDQDYQLRPRERRALRTAVDGVPVRPELHDLQLSEQELGDAVMSVLEVGRAYRLALERLD